MAISYENSGAAAHDAVNLGAAAWLSLAAAPTCALMALLTGILGGGKPDFLCAAMQDASPLGGMVPMYLLMSAFHLASWLKLFSKGRSSVSSRSQFDAK